MHIAYTTKNGIEYAALATSFRSGHDVRKTYINLGRVIDREHYIFKSREGAYSIMTLKAVTIVILIILSLTYRPNTPRHLPSGQNS